MSKRKKEFLSGNDDLQAKISLRRNSQLTGENCLEIPDSPQSNKSKRKSKSITAEAKDWEDTNKENIEVFVEKVQTSSDDEGRKITSELKHLNQTKDSISLSLSQNTVGKFVPVFAKPKKALPERTEKDDGEASEIQTEQEILESNPSCMDSSLACDSSEAAVQEVKSLSEPLELTHLLVGIAEEAGDQVIPQCQKHTGEGLEVKAQVQYQTESISSDAAGVGLGDSHQGMGAVSNLQEGICGKLSLEEPISLFHGISYCKDAGSRHDNRSLCAGSPENPTEKDASCSVSSEPRITDRGKDSQHEVLPSRSYETVQQKKSMLDETDVKLDDFAKNRKWTKNLSGKVLELADDTSTERERKTNVVKTPLTDININTAEEQDNSHTGDKAGQESSGVREVEQSSPHQDGKSVDLSNLDNGKIAELNDSKTQNSSAKMAAENRSQTSDMEQSSPCTNADITEQRDSCKVTQESSSLSSGKDEGQSGPCNNGGVTEKSSNDRAVSGRDFPSCAQAMIVNPEMDIHNFESKSEQTSETIHQCYVGTDRVSHSEVSKIPLQMAFYTGESDAGREEAEKTTGVSAGSVSSASVLVHGNFTCKNTQDHYMALEQWKENGNRLRPDRKQSQVGACDLGCNGLEAKSLNTGSVQPTVSQIPQARLQLSPSPDKSLNGKNNEEWVSCEKNKMKPFPTESCLSFVDVSEQPEREMVMTHHRKEADVNTSGQTSLSATHMDLPGGVPKSATPVDKTCSPWGETLPLDVELLPDSQLWDTLKDNSLELSLQQAFPVDRNCSSVPKNDLSAERELSDTETPVPGISIHHPKKLQPRVEMEGIYDPTKEEDATDVVCGLIIELSNLNRLIMSTHRDLESLKRLKYRKSRQSGKFLSHALKGAANTLYPGKKWKET
ncbi:PREDICTED: uncharacterized protein C19orf57 homolog isoform X2 [Gavialis gangeticus]|uniref:uncharacterized protein C19orf57 homolog isoform X2 n=1 Tax=Gavialis gangeticus TaxID=94835 RepID=UPI00092F9B5F|nr:PREDICTED: uncharacterized protein C19orf57 homolog isoform X2 [Gavialis gangeticus]